jgi:hypothetical protein
MSIQVWNRVWDHSTARTGELLVLLAIADHANDRGLAWPGIESLALKTRQTPRHLTRCLKRLSTAGELVIHAQCGPHGTNRYQVLCFPKSDGKAPNQSECQGDKPCQADNGVSQMSPKPSEPSEVQTHTLDAVVKVEKVSAAPSEQEVDEHAKTYAGNIAIGIPAGAIKTDWAKNYWSWRTFDKEHWPKRWREEIVHRFEREWQQGGSAARGYHKKHSAPLALERTGNEGLPPRPISSGPVTLGEMRAAVE